jgi:Domain of unknown function (DUF4124)
LNFIPRAGLAALAALTLTLVASGSVDAQKLYRYVDKDGKVTYSDTPPERLTTPDGRRAVPAKADEVKIDLKANLVAPGVSREAAEALRQREEAARNSEVSVANAERSVERILADARKAFEEAQAPRDDEWQQLVGGRRVPSEAYLQRRAKAEEALKAAEALAAGKSDAK